MRLFLFFKPLWMICLAKQVIRKQKTKQKQDWIFFSVFSALPRGGPTIKGGRLRYSLGDSVDVNCTSADSKPAADLHWFINGQPVSKNLSFILTFWPDLNVMSSRKVYLYNLSVFFSFFLSKMSCKKSFCFQSSFILVENHPKKSHLNDFYPLFVGSFLPLFIGSVFRLSSSFRSQCSKMRLFWHIFSHCDVKANVFEESWADL